MSQERPNNHSSSEDPWRVFRIMAEFVDGFDTMCRLGSAVTVFGSARTPPDRPFYQLAVQLGRRLAEEGFAVVTGGGPGIMEAANKGAFEAKGTSVGLNIVIPHEQKANPYLTARLDFDYFFARKVMFVKYSVALVCFPGGFGTIDELFEALTLIQTQRTPASPVILMGKTFWEPLLGWMRDTMLKEHETISPGDLDLFIITDDVELAVSHIVKNYQRAGTLWEHPTRTLGPGPATRAM